MAHVETCDFDSYDKPEGVCIEQACYELHSNPLVAADKMFSLFLQLPLTLDFNDSYQLQK